jgi:hypothetical protein
MTGTGSPGMTCMLAPHCDPRQARCLQCYATQRSRRARRAPRRVYCGRAYAGHAAAVTRRLSVRHCRSEGSQMDIAIGVGVLVVAVLLGIFALVDLRGLKRWNQTPRETLNDVLERERANKWSRPF